MERLPHFILFLFLSVFFTVWPSANADVKSVFVFGDSQFDPGNNKYIKNCTLQANFPPYGKTYFPQPTGRFTNGRTVIDFISQFLDIPFTRPYQEVYRELNDAVNDNQSAVPPEGLNFASAGSGLLPDTNKNNLVSSIQAQLQQFESLIDNKTLNKDQVANSMFFLESGANDIFTYFLVPKTLSPQELAQAMQKEVIQFIEKIYKNGGRRFVIFSVGPIGCVPGRVLIKNASVDECYGPANRMVKYINFGLERLTLSIPRRYPGSIGVYAEVFHTVQAFRITPELFGFTNVSEGCCGGGPLNGVVQCGLLNYTMCDNPNEYFFWDYFHPSERANGLLANALWYGGFGQIRPINLWTLARIP